MRNFIKLFGMFMILLIFMVTAITIYTKDAKRKETREAISESMEIAMNNLTKDELKALSEKDLADYIVSQIALRVTSIDKGIDIDIYDIDYANGMVDAEVTAYFNYILGGNKVVLRKTLYIDEYIQKQNKQFVENESSTEEASQAELPIDVSKVKTHTSIVVDHEVDKMFDKKNNTYWQSGELDDDDELNSGVTGSNDENETESSNESETDITPIKDIIEINIGRICYINQIDISWGDNYAKDFEIQVSMKNNNWKTVYRGTKENNSEDKIVFPEEVCGYVRVVCNQSSSEDNNYQIKEMKIWQSLQ